MINFHLHVSGPRIKALIAISNGEYRSSGGSIVVAGMERDGLLSYTTVPSPEIEGITVSQPTITERGRVVLELIASDVAKYLARIKRPPRPTRPVKDLAKA